MATKVERHLLTIHADRSISVETDIPIVAGSIGVDEVLISFEEPEDWADMSLTVTMVSSVVETPYTVLWDGESAFNVPWELTQEIGVIGFSVLGISSSTQSYQRGLTQSSVGLLTVVTPGINVGDPPVEPTPSAYERVLAMIQSLPEVESRAEAVINDLDNAFRGVAQYLPVGMGNVVTAELDGTDSELVSVADAFKNGKLLGAKVYGKSTQESTTGKNLLIPYDGGSVYSVNDITFNIQNDGTIIANGTASRTAVLQWSVLREGTPSYAIDSDVKYCLSGCPSGGSDTMYSIVLARNGGSAVVTVRTGGAGTIFTGNSLIEKIQIVIRSGVTVNNLVFKPMVSLGEEVPDYEPYTGGIASPNPDYPQEIKSVAEGDIELIGKNLLYDGYMKNDIEHNQGIYTNKITDNLGSFRMVYSLYDKNNQLIGNAVGILPITNSVGRKVDTFTMQGYDNAVTIRICHNGRTRNVYMWDIPYEKWMNGKKFTVSLNILSNDLSVVGGFKFSEPQLEIGTVSTNFVPGETPDSLHFLPDDVEPLRSLPDGIRDVLTIDANGNGVIERNVGVFDLSNQNRWSKSSYGNFDRFSSYSVIGNAIKTTARYSNVLSDKFMHSSDPIANPNTPNTIALYNQVVYILVDKDIYDTDTFKTYIGSIKPTLFYQLASPTTEIIPASRMPKVPSQYLHAWLEAKDQNGEEIVTDYSIYYEKSIGALLSQIEQALDAAGYPITDYEPEDAMSVAPELSNDANPVTDAQMAAAVTYGFTLN